MPLVMTSIIAKGVLAGASGTALLTATTYLDMALTGRPASSAPDRTVAALLRRADLPVPGDDRLAALGALSGIATGLGVGVIAALVRARGVRLPAAVGAPAVGALAMVATDASMAVLGVSDPRSWSAADWTRDVVPHLAYGVGVRATLDTLDKRVQPTTAERKAPGRPAAGRPRGRLLGRSLLLGLAAGGRSSLGYLAVARNSPWPAATAVAAVSVVGEVVADKLPVTPSRLDPLPLLGRVTAGAVGGLALARGRHANVILPALVGAGGAVAGSVLGAAWREIAASNGWTWQAALAEDAASLALAWTAFR